VTYTVVPAVTVRTGTRALTATVGPTAGERIFVDRWNGTKWLADRSAAANARGTATFTRLSSAYYRVRIAATATHTWTTSPSVRVR
jgi:hypothetical protein